MQVYLSTLVFPFRTALWQTHRQNGCSFFYVFWCQVRLIEVRLAKDTQSKRVPFQNVIVDPAILAMAHRNGQAMNGVGGERSVPEVHGLSQCHQIGDPDLGTHRKHPRLYTLVAPETVLSPVHLDA